MPHLDPESVKLLEDAVFAYTEGRFNDAFPVLEKLASTGNLEAIRGLAEMYLRGEGVEANVQAGIKLLRHAADLGHANSAYCLGALYRSGAYGVPRDAEQSKFFFLLAKDLGCELPIHERP